MKTQIHATNFSITQTLLSFVQKKIDKLEVFYSHIINGDVFLRLNNEGKENKTVEIKLYLPGHQLFVKEQASSFEEAISKTTDVLERQLKKIKSKISRKN